jgi:hypothetical protein
MRIVLGVLGIVGIALAVMYFTIPADHLPVPHFLGHDAGLHATHAKHGILALVAGIACLFLAWRQSPA